MAIGSALERGSLIYAFDEHGRRACRHLPELPSNARLLGSADPIILILRVRLKPFR
jgi:hypothetical protein